MKSVSAELKCGPLESDQMHKKSCERIFCAMYVLRCEVAMNEGFEHTLSVDNFVSTRLPWVHNCKATQQEDCTQLHFLHWSEK